MKIGSWNLLHGIAIPEGVTDTAKLEKAAGLIDLDLLALQEVDFFQERSAAIDQTALIAQSMGAEFYNFTPSILGTPGEKWSATKFTKARTLSEASQSYIANQNCAYGVSIISKIPIKAIHILELGNSPIGFPLLIPNQKKGELRPRFIYVADEPRIAQAAVLENGITVINTHLSFMPGVNIYQLRKIKKWAVQLPGKKILIGDLNLPGKIPTTTMGWNNLITLKTYPSWKPRTQFDHALSEDFTSSGVRELRIPPLGISDHLPIAFELLKV